MKLPLQTAAILRAGNSGPARHSSAVGVSGSFRHDINICQYDTSNPKCEGDRSVYTCATVRANVATRTVFMKNPVASVSAISHERPAHVFSRRPFEGRPDMKLPVQSPAVLRGSNSWPTRGPSRGDSSAGIQPAKGVSVNCSGTTPRSCICENGVATCCTTNETCSVNESTGACNCGMGGTK